MKARLLTLFVVVTSVLVALANAGISTSPGGKWR
jgi:hypothetical protein